MCVIAGGCGCVCCVPLCVCCMPLRVYLWVCTCGCESGSCGVMMYHLSGHNLL